MTLLRSIAIAGALGALTGSLLVVHVRAGGDKVVFPANYQGGVKYADVDRYDLKQVRDFYASPAAVEAARKGEPLPSGTVITQVGFSVKLDDKGSPIKDANGRFIKDKLVTYVVMEKRTGWGTEYPDNIRNGEWEYQQFLPDMKPNPQANLTACFQCHKPHAGQDFVISLAYLKGAKPEQAAGQPRPPAGPGVVDIGNYEFVPAQVMIAAGQPITWVNTDAAPHQISLMGSKPQRTAILLKGQSAQLTIAEPGTYDYICGLHPRIKGKIEVK
jgi:plastocyanin